MVASNKKKLSSGECDLWDSGKIDSSQSFGIRYAGRQLVSRLRCWWRVQVWTQDDLATASDASWWEMGLLEPQAWAAQWLSVEDADTEADRESGVRWVWGEPSLEEPGARRFRFHFELPSVTVGGELFAITNDALWTSHVSGIWIDGDAYRGDPNRRFSHDWVGVESDPLTAQRLSLEPLGTGAHLLAVEVRNNGSPPASMPRALAVLMRLTLQTGEVLRLSTGPAWKSRAEPHEAADWYSPRYRDEAWKATRSIAIEGFHPLPPAPAMHLRRVFVLDRQPVEARLYATAMGTYEARLNGHRVSDRELAPEISQYAERVLYQVYEVSGMLQLGENVCGLTVADGWYGSWEGRYSWGPPPRRVLAQLELIFADGSTQVIATGPGWRTSESPIQEAQVRVGVIYDARLEQAGWDRVQFDDNHWQEAKVADPPPCRLVAQLTPPIRVTQTLKPCGINQPKAGLYVFDFGQNFAGWCRLKVKGTRGSRIGLTFAELLLPSGEINQDRYDVGEPKRDLFILRGASEGEVFEPSFIYRGFRYVQLSGLPVAPTLDSLEGLVVHSDIRSADPTDMGNDGMDPALELCRDTHGLPES
jgi:alpha-L-rhamnosidase